MNWQPCAKIVQKGSHSLSIGSPAFSRPMSLGTEGPKMSRSSRPTRGFRKMEGSFDAPKERFEIARARLA